MPAGLRVFMPGVAIETGGRIFKQYFQPAWLNDTGSCWRVAWASYDLKRQRTQLRSKCNYYIIYIIICNYWDLLSMYQLPLFSCLNVLTENWVWSVQQNFATHVKWIEIQPRTEVIYEYLWYQYRFQSFRDLRCLNVSDGCGFGGLTAYEKKMMKPEPLRSQPPSVDMKTARNSTKNE